MNWGVMAYVEESRQVLIAGHNFKSKDSARRFIEQLRTRFTGMEFGTFTHLFYHETGDPTECHLCAASVNEQLDMEDERYRREHPGGEDAQDPADQLEEGSTPPWPE